MTGPSEPSIWLAPPVHLRLRGWARPLWFDKAGAPISSDEWARLKHEGSEYSRVAADQIGDVWVSTVWLGIDHGFDDGPPVIFETMTFSDRPRWDSMLMGRYVTEEQALDGHRAACAEVRGDPEGDS